MKNRKKNVLLFLAGVVTALCVSGGLSVAFQAAGQGAPGSRASEAKIREISRIIEDEYLYEADDTKLADSMYDGLMDGLDDPYADYYTKKEYEEISESNEGHYQGIGIVMLQDKETGEISVGHCYEGGPADKAGMQQGDILYKVGDELTEGKELSEIADTIKGSDSDTVIITVYREEEDSYIELEIEKAEIEIPVVKSEMKEDKIGYIAIYQFTGVTAEQFENAYKELQEQGMERLIVDLRDNPGGLLNGVCDTLNVFMPKGLLVYTEDKKGKRQELYADGKTPIEIPMVVLVNENSASASEIFAGAVKDYGVGTLVGTTTYGKGIVQQTFGLIDGSYIKLTVSSYYTPNGTNIHGTGIEPDVIVEQAEDSKEDVQLQKALEIVKKG